MSPQVLGSIKKNKSRFVIFDCEPTPRTAAPTEAASVKHLDASAGVMSGLSGCAVGWGS